MANHSALEDWATWALSPSISAILFTLLIALTLPTLVHWYLYRKALSKEIPAFLLVGPSGGGKTSLSTLMANDVSSTTHQSMTLNTVHCTLPSQIRPSADRFRSENDDSSKQLFSLVDTPGHGKLRHHAFNALTSNPALQGVMYVLDSAAIASTSGLTEAAGYLHDVLLVLQKKSTQNKTAKGAKSLNVLVAANKQDVFTSLPVGLVRSKLEEEIGRVRSTKSRKLMDSGAGGTEEDEDTDWLGEYGAKEFKFGQMEEFGLEIVVVGGSVHGEGGAEEKGKVEGWWRWIGENL